MRTSLEDLIATCPNELAANSIIVYDWCHWILQQIPEDPFTCEELLACIDCAALLNIIHFGTGLLVDPNTCTVSVDPSFINDTVFSNFSCATGTPLLTIGLSTWDLSCILNAFVFTFQDGVNTVWVHNMDLITIAGLDGMRFIVGGAHTLNVWLPTWGTNWQVLTRNGTTHVAYRANISALCCDRVYECMDPIIQMIQNQINILAGQLCPCWTWEGWYYIDIYSTIVDWQCLPNYDPQLIQANVQQLNFQVVDANWDPICSDCLYAERVAGAPGHANVNLKLDLTWWGCEPWDGQYVLSLCWSEVDLSCLAQTPLINIYDDNLLILSTVDISFDWCFDVTDIWGVAHITFNPDLQRSGCVGQTPYILSLCGESVDLSCLATQPYVYVNRTVFVMENGSDITWVAERFDLPFATISAAMTAANALPLTPYDKWVTVVVYPGVYDWDSDAEIYWPVNLHLMDWAIIHWQITIMRHESIGDITGDGTVWIDGTTDQNVIHVGDPIWETHDIQCKVELKDIILQQTATSPQTMNIINMATTALANRIAVHSRHCYVINTNIDQTIRPNVNGVYTLWWATAALSRTIDLAIDDFEIDARNVQLALVNVGEYENVYVHNTNIHEWKLLKIWGNPVRWMSNMSWGSCDIYRENIFIEWVINSNRQAAPNAFIFVPYGTRNGTKWSLKDTHFHFTSDDEAAASIFIYGSVTWAMSTNTFNLYGNNYIILWDAYTDSLHPGALAPNPNMFNILWWWWTTKSWNRPSCGYYMHQGIEHMELQLESIGDQPFGPMEMPRQSF